MSVPAAGTGRCPVCARSLWLLELPEVGALGQCPSCRITVRNGDVLKWRQAEAEPALPEEQAPRAEMRKYRSDDPCPECRRPMWAVEVPHYGVRHQCDDCRLSVVFGGVIRWR